MSNQNPDPDTGWKIEPLLENLSRIYSAKSSNEAWNAEKNSIQRQLRALSNHLSTRYSDPEVLARGGSGILLKVSDSRLHSTPRVIKFPRPLEESASEFVSLLKNEIRLLAEVRSRNVVAIHEGGEAKLEETDKLIGGLQAVPYYVMDQVSGDDSDKHFIKQQPSELQFVRFVQEALHAIRHLHERQLVHLDIKPSNIRVDHHGNPILLDLGTTKHLNPKDSNPTKVGVTFRFAPQEELQHLHETSQDPSRAEGDIPRKDIKLTWDLHTLSHTLTEWINCVLRHSPDALSVFTRKYLRLMAIRFWQDPYTTDQIKKIGLPPDLVNALRYGTIAQACDDIAKLSTGVDIAEIIPELNDQHHETIQVAADRPTTFTKRVKETVDHPVFHRLGEVSHLGIVRLVYPTATHSRLEHSLGTYHNAARYLRALYHDPLNPLFRQLMEPVHYRATLLTALLHDVGQFPLAHDLEDIDKELFDHVALGRSLVVGIREPKKKGTRKKEFPDLDKVFEAWEVKPDDVLRIFDAKLTGTDPRTIRERILKSIISGPLDADKLDYLVRDATRLRVPYPFGIDFERLLRTLTLVVKAPSDGVHACVGVHEKGRIPAEFVTMARYAMFSQVYWHHAVRAAKAMLGRALNALIGKLEEDKSRSAVNSFRSEFEDFVLYGESGWGNQQARQGLLPGFAPMETETPQRSAEAFGARYGGATLDRWDMDVLKFFQKWMEKHNLPERQLIGDLIKHSLYKRVYQFSAEESPHVWENFTQQWDRLRPAERNERTVALEKALLTKAGKKLEERKETAYLTPDEKSGMETRVKAGLPLLLLDVPSSRGQSDIPLEFVAEEDRRELRKEDRICGRCVESPAWKLYSKNLRQHAGRIRVFAHPKFVNVIQSSADHDWFAGLLANLNAIGSEQEEERQLSGL